MSTYMDAYNKWLIDRSPENMAALVEAFAPTINSEIMRYEGPKNLLRSKAKALTIGAIRSYNPASGAKLQSWVVTQLQPLSRYGQGLRDVKVPELAIRQAAEVNRITEALKDTLGRDPTDEEIADEVGISVKRVRNVRKMAVPSINTGRMDSSDTDENSSSQPGVMETNKLPFATDAVYMSLDDRDKKIFDMRTGSHGSKVYSATDVAARLGISSASVSQRANSIASQIAGIAGNQ